MGPAKRSDETKPLFAVTRDGCFQADAIAARHIVALMVELAALELQREIVTKSA